MIASASNRPERIEVEGHTCICGSAEANNELGRKTRGGGSGLSHLEAGSPGTRPGDFLWLIRPVESAGEPNLPAAVCERDSIHSQNRRVVIVVYSRPGTEPNATNPAPHLDVSFLARPAGTHSYGQISDGSQLRTGDEYMIRLRADTPLYVYAFHQDPKGWVVLFPTKTDRTGSASLANPVEPGNELSIPAPNAGFVLDNVIGLEGTYIYSARARSGDGGADRKDQRRRGRQAAASRSWGASLQDTEEGNAKAATCT